MPSPNNEITKQRLNKLVNPPSTGGNICAIIKTNMLPQLTEFLFNVVSKVAAIFETDELEMRILESLTNVFDLDWGVLVGSHLENQVEFNGLYVWFYMGQVDVYICWRY
ncbi:uncharacterized protein LOC119661969 [Teleopsis dalmanni]|uniref:uncharacterized protein LOC119661969 n=1 Tax=Teleopsis dalmanni TaxID=139649 RepID=UPI0018CF991C|nr:uncharacterized protein LOC119661969 [Teleopsis dalmanni]